MARAKLGQDVFANLRFPLNGLDLSQKPSEQRPGTTPNGVNVRAYDQLRMRARGGSRPGIKKYSPAQVSGNNAIQHINSIVTVSGDALGSGFDGVDLGDIGGLGIDNGPGNLGGNDFTGWGGGGYQPFVVYQKQKYQLSLSTTAGGSVPAGDPVTIVATLKDSDGHAGVGDTIVLHTSPSGRTGDGESGVSGAGGTVVFIVTDTLSEKVTYSASDTTNPGNSVNQIVIQYTPSASGFVILGNILGASVTPGYAIDLNLNGTGFDTGWNGVEKMWRTNANIPFNAAFLLDGVNMGNASLYTVKTIPNLFTSGADTIGLHATAFPAGDNQVFLIIHKVNGNGTFTTLLGDNAHSALGISVGGRSGDQFSVTNPQTGNFTVP